MYVCKYVSYNIFITHVIHNARLNENVIDFKG